MIRYVWWQSLVKLNCTEVIVCVTPAKIGSGSANPEAIEGNIVRWFPVRGDAYYRYYIEYNDNQLVAGQYLLESDVLDAFCKDCLADWAKGNTPTIVETDPIFSASPAATITLVDIANWNAPAGPEVDPIFTAWLAGPPAISIFTNDAGYLTAETDPVFSAWLLTNPLAGYVPYVGATADVNLGVHDLELQSLTAHDDCTLARDKKYYLDGL